MSVPPLALLALQITMSGLALAWLTHTVVLPALRAMPSRRALAAMLWVHVPRYVPLALLAPGQTDAAADDSAISVIAWGDFTASVLAIAALVALHRSSRAGVPWVWVFFVESTVDIVAALSLGLGSGIHEQALGFGWYVLTLYVPMVCVSHGLIGAWLLAGDRLSSRKAA